MEVISFPYHPLLQYRLINFRSIQFCTTAVVVDLLSSHHTMYQIAYPVVYFQHRRCHGSGSVGPLLAALLLLQGTPCLIL